METNSLKALAIKVLQRNLKGNFKETIKKEDGNLKEHPIVELPLIEAGKINLIPETLNDLSPEQRESYEERAGIMQYEGGLSKEGAEKYGWCFQVCMLTETMSKECERVRPCPKWN